MVSVYLNIKIIYPIIGYIYSSRHRLLLSAKYLFKLCCLYSQSRFLLQVAAAIINADEPVEWCHQILKPKLYFIG